MRGLNRVIICGHVGHTPELRTTAIGKIVCDLRIATNHSRRDGDGWSEETEWHRVTLWEKQAEIAQRFLSKGSATLIEGRLKTTSWEDKQTGQRRYRTGIVCEKLLLLDSGHRTVQVAKDGSLDDTGQQLPQGQLPQHTLPIAVAEDSVPF